MALTTVLQEYRLFQTFEVFIGWNARVTNLEKELIVLTYFLTQIALLQDERDELKRECKILKEKCKDNDHLSNANKDLMNKVRTLQEQFYNEQDSNREKLRKLREVSSRFCLLSNLRQ